MVGVAIHAVVYAVVNAFLVGVWLVTTGSNDEFARVLEDPVQGVRDGFWPAWVIGSWGVAVGIHVGVWLSVVLFSNKRRKRRMMRAAERSARHRAVTKELTRGAVNLLESFRSESSSWELGDPADGAERRRWVVAMFTDIAGSTDLAESLGDAQWMEVLTSHRAVVRSNVLATGGTEVSTQGDGFLVRFDNPSDAVRCATAIQRQLEQHRERGELVPAVRIGIHAGEAVDEGGDLIGRVVNLAARVMSAADPGEVLVTEPVADHIDDVALDDRGLVSLRGVGRPRHLLAVAWQTEAVASGADVARPVDDELQRRQLP